MEHKRVKLDLTCRMYVNFEKRPVYKSITEMEREYQSRMFPMLYLLFKRTFGVSKDLFLHMTTYFHRDYFECPIWNFFRDFKYDRDKKYILKIRPGHHAPAFKEAYRNTGKYMPDAETLWRFEESREHPGLFWIFYLNGKYAFDFSIIGHKNTRTYPSHLNIINFDI